jgi:hypothetical protein
MAVNSELEAANIVHVITWCYAVLHGHKCAPIWSAMNNIFKRVMWFKLLRDLFWNGAKIAKQYF